MRKHRSPPFIRAILLSLLVVGLLPVGSSAQTDPVDVSAAFLKRGAVIENLAAVEISGIVVIRGKTNDRLKAEGASRIATELGFMRVANLIVVRDDATDDAAIMYAGRRILELEPDLAGSSIRIDSRLGVVQLTGSVQQDAQSELAVYILRNITGVKAVHSSLVRP